ncbi:hypothetical protein [Nocardia crassostreae]|uniref:hypothetical protein n=1 Tax=Nocardia crassostreae TaxID=53428 RepID=UPI0008347B90|nr:hypothetical protein [Nocardia crassostreae]
MTAGHISDTGGPLTSGREATRELVRELSSGAVESRTGILRVTGDPGGDFYLIDGNIVMVASAGTPGVHDLLMRPGRTSSGAADLRLVAMMAALDGAFSIASGWLGDCRWQSSAVPPPGLVPMPSIDSGWLLLETERRLRALAHGPVSPHRNHLSLTDRGRALLAGSERTAWQDILFWVNGRRTCRDIALLLSRGLYAVTVEVSRMLDAGVLVITPVRPEVPEQPPPRPGTPRSVLPRRRRGASGINDTLPTPSPRAASSGRQASTPVREQERTT